MSTAERKGPVVILGGGPAGLATAIALRQRGVACTVVEPLVPPIDKGCGEGLMPDALEALRTLDVHLSAAHGYAFRGIRFSNKTHSVEGRFPKGTALGVRRTVLHRSLADRAAALGADLRWGSRATLPAGGPGDHSIRIDGEDFKFGFLIGADGHGSTVRRWAELDAGAMTGQRLGLRRHYHLAPWSDAVEVYWGRSAQAYITPVAADCVSVVFVGNTRSRHEPASRPELLLEDFPALAARLRHAPLLSPQRGGVSATRTLRRVSNGSVALVGDASGSVDAITGEGLALAFRQASALADCIAANDLHPYGAAHRKISSIPRRMARMLLLMDRYPLIEATAMRLLAACPALFEQLLAKHVGAGNCYRDAFDSGPASALPATSPNT